MTKKLTVEHTWCSACGKRGFADRRLARKALGRAQAKRNRIADKVGTRRGLIRENRYYNDCPSGLYHLTGMSRRQVSR